MFIKLVIGLVAFLAVAGSAGAMEWQPAWAPQPIPLVQGAEYCTGSPLSKPGLFGLFGGIANTFANGNLPQFTGGGVITWEGPTVAPATVTINGVEISVFTHAEAEAAQEDVDWSTVENKDRGGTSPGPKGGCGYSFAKAVEMDTAYDWCEQKSIEHASIGQCPEGQRIFVVMVPDDVLGARVVYTCQEVTR